MSIIDKLFAVNLIFINNEKMQNSKALQYYIID